KSTSSTEPSTFGVHNGLGASVALIRLGEKSIGCVGNDLFLEAVDLGEASGCGGGNVRSTTADDEDEEGLVDECREERRRMFAMIEAVVGVGDVDGDAGGGEGKVGGGVRVAGVNGAGGAGNAEEAKKEDTSPRRLAMATATAACVNGSREYADGRHDRASCV
ncbi:hypothetical protein GP486_006871, partial [Trichoglossum hirsutum]